MNAVLKDKVLHYLNELREEKVSAAETVKTLIGYTKEKKNEMLLNIQDEVNELKRIMKWLVEDE